MPSSAMQCALPSAATAALLAGVRTDDLAAIPIDALLERNPQARARDRRGGAARLRQPGRRGQPQRRAHGAAAGGLAGIGARGRPSTACADRVWMRSPWRRARSAAARRSSSPAASSRCRARRLSCPRRTRPSRATRPCTTPRSVGASSIPEEKSMYGVDSMPETGENVAAQFQVGRADQDGSRCAASSAPRRAMRAMFFADELARGVDPTAQGSRRSWINATSIRGRTRRSTRWQHCPSPRSGRGNGDRRQRLGHQRRCQRAARRLGRGGEAPTSSHRARG